MANSPNCRQAYASRSDALVEFRTVEQRLAFRAASPAALLVPARGTEGVVTATVTPTSPRTSTRRQQFTMLSLEPWHAFEP